MRTVLLSLFLATSLLAACGPEDMPSADEASDSLTGSEEDLLSPGSSEPAAERASQALQQKTQTEESAAALAGLDAALAGSHRDPQAAARDQYRHPRETLAFFGLEPDMTVVELWPGAGGWYTEVLAPVLRDQGQFIAASYPPEAESEYYRESEAQYRQKLEAHPEVYSGVTVVPFLPPEFANLGEPGSADLVLTFRNLHNWQQQGVLPQVFEAAYEVLKPGGVFGVAEHRAAEGVTMEEAAGSGYMPTDYVIQLAEDAGFTLAAKSEINANPKDSTEHPEGVWTLPPGLALCSDMPDGEEKTACTEKYRAIGESDRMTLKFVKGDTRTAPGP